MTNSEQNPPPPNKKSTPNTQQTPSSAQEQNAQQKKYMSAQEKLRLRDPQFHIREHFRQEKESTFTRYWKKCGRLLGHQGNFLLLSRFVRMGFFPTAVFCFAIFALYRPEILPFNSWDRVYKKFVETHDISGSQQEYFMEKAKKDSLFMELRQIEISRVEQWNRDHPGEKLTPKIRRRIRNSVVKELMEKYNLDKVEAPTKQEAVPVDAL